MVYIFGSISLQVSRIIRLNLPIRLTFGEMGICRGLYETLHVY